MEIAALEKLAESYEERSRATEIRIPEGYCIDEAGLAEMYEITWNQACEIFSTIKIRGAVRSYIRRMVRAEKERLEDLKFQEKRNNEED